MALFWRFIIAQAFECGLPHSTGCRALHEFYDAYQTGFQPDRTFVARMRRDWRFFSSRCSANAPEILTAYPEGYVAPKH